MTLTAATSPTAPGRDRSGRICLNGGKSQSPSTLAALHSARSEMDERAEQAIALEKSGERHRARLVWIDLATSASDERLRRHKIFRRLAKDAAARNADDAAIDYLERHLRLMLDDRDASDWLLRLRLDRATVGERRRIYANHIALYGETLSTRIHRATLVEAPVSLDAATSSLEQIERQARPDRDLLLAVAEGYEHLGNLSRALAMLDEDLARSSSRAGKMRLRLLRASGSRKAESLASAAELIAAEPTVASHHVLHGRILRKFDDLAGAASAFEHALGLDQNDVPSWEGAIAAYSALERQDRVASLLSEARAHFRRRGYEGRVALARIEIAAGRHNEAIDAVRHVLNNPSVGARAGKAMALAMVGSGQYFQGWSHMAAALRTDAADIALRRVAVRCAVALRSVGVRGADLPQFPDALFARALLDPPAFRIPEVTDTVLLATSSLGAGGAERQVALTAAGMARIRAGRGRTILAGLDLTPARGRSMMRPLAETDHLDIVDLASWSEGHIFRSLSAEHPSLRETLTLIGSFPRTLSRDILKLYQCFRLHRPSIVHLWQDGVIATGSVAAVLAGVPRIVCSMRNVVASDTDRRRYRSFLYAMYRGLSERPEVTFTANSAAGARDYEAWLGFSPGRIRVLRNGVDVQGIRSRAPVEAQREVRQKLGFPSGSLIIGGVFRLAPAKRPHLWLDVVSRVLASDPRVRGVIVGDGAMRDEIERAIAAKGLQGRIVLAGRQSPIEPWMAVMDVLLLSSEVEGLPNVLLEAESLGVPVVTTEAGGSGEAILDAITGKLVIDDTPGNLAGAVVAVLNSSSMRKRARVGSPVFVEQRFGLARMLAETLEAYGESASTPCRRAT